ncbi:hypothetical protein L1987_22565 [Smallanthus sonchifolius]|uniref:Uncharacterized protein n=1 Tax=Smallanthus sonchifolius TaxID=185202 RepID=A0ACB9IG47_9ASTR|nr:hypothetical protein L1987_22565 [Smallanthus sonchifolius]
MNTPANIPFSWENTPGVRKDPCHENLVGDWWSVAVKDNSSTGERRRVEVHDSSSSLRWRLTVHENSSTREGRRVAVHDSSSTEEGRSVSVHDSSSTEEGRLPPPPCVFQPRIRSSSRRSKDDDPFLMAYKECTKSNKKGTLMRKTSIFGSCKYYCSVRDESIVRVSQIPMSNSDGKRFQGFNHQG